MSHKLAQLKTWLSCEDAAKYLAALLDTPVTVSDVLQLVAEEQLQVSVYFPTPQPARRMRKVAREKSNRVPVFLPNKRGDLSDAEWARIERLRWALNNQGTGFETEDFLLIYEYLQTINYEEFSRPNDSELYAFYFGLPFDKEHVLEEHDLLVDIRGYWNIETIGGGHIELKNRFLESIEVETGEQIAWKGIILRQPGDEDNWLALCKMSQKFSEEGLKQLSEFHQSKGWSLSQTALKEDGFTNADKLPENSHLVFNRKELQRFISQLGNEEDTDRQDYPTNLDALVTAWRKWWKNADHHDRSTHPKKDNVKSWLTEQGLSDRTADAGATIITPDWKK